jgi:hypothetical protein
MLTLLNSTNLLLAQEPVFLLRKLRLGLATFSLRFLSPEAFLFLWLAGVSCATISAAAEDEVLGTHTMSASAFSNEPERRRRFLTGTAVSAGSGPSPSEGPGCEDDALRSTTASTLSPDLRFCLLGLTPASLGLLAPLLALALADFFRSLPCLLLLLDERFLLRSAAD